MTYDEVLMRLTKPDALRSRAEVIGQSSAIPPVRGLYAWFFREVPRDVPVENCITIDGLTLLYVGISPSNPNSTQHLRKRIRHHFFGNAEGSTLRQTLGVLLAEKSGFPLRRVGSGRRMTFTHLGEQWLDDWMQENAFVACVPHPAPWEIEANIFQKLSLPLNIQDNRHHPYAPALSRYRSEAKALARNEPIANEGNQSRRTA